MEAQSLICTGRAALSSLLSKASAAGKDVTAVLSYGLRGCRAEQGGHSQEVWEGAMPVPEPPATTGMCPPLGAAQPSCVLTMGAWSRRYRGTWTWGSLIAPSQHKLCLNTALKINPLSFCATECMRPEDCTACCLLRQSQLKGKCKGNPKTALLLFDKQFVRAARNL